MGKLLVLVLLLTVMPGYALWAVLAALLPGALLVVEEVGPRRAGMRRRGDAVLLGAGLAGAR